MPASALLKVCERGRKLDWGLVEGGERQRRTMGESARPSDVASRLGIGQSRVMRQAGDATSAGKEASRSVISAYLHTDKQVHWTRREGDYLELIYLAHHASELGARCMPERRKHHRVSVQLKTRFMLQDGTEHSAETIDASLNGISFRSRVVPYKGQRVIAYVSDLGRIEGIATRISKEGFAISVAGSRYRKDKIAGALTWAKLEELGSRGADRIVPTVREGRLFTNNSLHSVDILNVSTGGALIKSDVFLPLGTSVRLGEHFAIVLRVENGSYALAFEKELDPSTLSADIRFI